MKDQTFDPEAALLDLNRAIAAIPAVNIVHTQQEVDTRHGVAALISVETALGTRNIYAEARASGEPRHIRETSFVLRDWMSQRSEPTYGLVVAPFISAESREILRKEGQGWFDLAGNCLLSFDGIHVEIAKTDTNPFSQKRKHLSVFSPKSGRVLRLLLTEPGPWKGTDIVSRARVSAGQVSKVREALLDHEWATSSRDGLRISQPKAVIQAWREARRTPATIRASGYTLLHGNALEGRMQVLFGKARAAQYATLLLASHSVARRVAPYARISGEFFYADKKGLELIQEELQLERADEGANIIVYEPEDELLSIDSIPLKPEPLQGTGLIQTYLDLCVAGDRGREAADFLFNEKIAPKLKGES